MERDYGLIVLGVPVVCLEGFLMGISEYGAVVRFWTFVSLIALMIVTGVCWYWFGINNQNDKIGFISVVLLAFEGLVFCGLVVETVIRCRQENA